MKPTDRRIRHKQKLRLDSETALREYYETKYEKGGYEGAGYTIRGIDISARYHQRRWEAALRFVDTQPQDTVLDAGCGAGELATAWRKA